MKIISYNVNGIRSAISKNWLQWLQASDADVVCLQEIKVQLDQIPMELKLIEDLGYHHYWYPAQKKRIQWGSYIMQTKTKPCRIWLRSRVVRLRRQDYTSGL